MILPKPRYKVFLKEEDDKHFYSVDGTDTWFVGATTILNAYPKQLYLTPWGAKTVAEFLHPYLRGIKTFTDLDALLKEAKREHKRIKTEAGELGSLFHELANKVVKNKLGEGDPVDIKEVPESLTIPWNSFLLWVEERKPQFLLPDTAVVDEEEGYGGSFDCVILEKGKPLLLDFKTSSVIGQDYAFQLGAYSNAFKSTYEINFYPKGRVVRFAKIGKPKYEEKTIRDIEASFQGFLCCLELYKNMQMNHWAEN